MEDKCLRELYTTYVEFVQSNPCTNCRRWQLFCAVDVASVSLTLCPYIASADSKLITVLCVVAVVVQFFPIVFIVHVPSPAKLDSVVIVEHNCTLERLSIICLKCLKKDISQSSLIRFYECSRKILFRICMSEHLISCLKL